MTLYNTVKLKKCVFQIGFICNYSISLFKLNHLHKVCTKSIIKFYKDGCNKCCLCGVTLKCQSSCWVFILFLSTSVFDLRLLDSKMCEKLYYRTLFK